MSTTSFSSAADLIRAAVTEFESEISAVLALRPTANVLFTGGSLGIEFLSELGKRNLPWTRIWMMFSDERFVPFEHRDRNESQGIAVWADLEKFVTRFPKGGKDLSLAAAELEQELANNFGSISGSSAVFDITVLGMGPDAHVASLFPQQERSGGWVIAEPESPKPPAQRLSLSYAALNRSERVWFLAAGSGKAWAVRQSLDASSGLPASRVRGLSETRWFLDQEVTDAL